MPNRVQEVKLPTGNTHVKLTVTSDGKLGLSFGQRVRSVVLEDPIALADKIYEEYRRSRAWALEEVVDG